MTRVAATFEGEPLLTPEFAIKAATEGLEAGEVEIAGAPYGSSYAAIVDFSGATVGLAHVLVPLEGYHGISMQMNLMAAVAGLVALLAGAAAARIFGGRISATLEDLSVKMNRMASGDTDVEFDRAAADRGEIGRMAKSLEVFRQSLIDKVRLEKEEAAARAEAEKAAAARREDEARQRALEAEQEREARDRKEAEAAEREAARRQADAEREAREAEQQKVVGSLASGLQRFASGDLRVKLDQPFAEGYEQLRQRFQRRRRNAGRADPGDRRSRARRSAAAPARSRTRPPTCRAVPRPRPRRSRRPLRRSTS